MEVVGGFIVLAVVALFFMPRLCGLAAKVMEKHSRAMPRLYAGIALAFRQYQREFNVIILPGPSYIEQVDDVPPELNEAWSRLAKSSSLRGR